MIGEGKASQRRRQEEENKCRRNETGRVGYRSSGGGIGVRSRERVLISSGGACFSCYSGKTNNRTRLVIKLKIH
ncbi:unnamed protein product [Arabis nemorensis]|uniref:Uncharacterized protein n=1 Tax=Arabis nemorensis TaxID=586526 RepID=A0A565BAD1_9BRAS|nr:unnamed protein product [Arabis nemorensis]